MIIDEIEGLLKECADAHYADFEQLGHAVPGWNGPYGCRDTPVRNTGHWLIIYACLWKRTHDENYRRIALAFADYLIKVQRQSLSGAIACVEDGADDHINGLIGQAWAIEALVYAFRTFGRRSCLDAAVRIFRSQRFDPGTGFWERVDPDGTVIGYDLTLNHQVWFGIAGMMILTCTKDRMIRRQVKRHLHYVRNEYFGVHRDGLIRHFGAMKRPRKAFIYLYLKQYIKYAGLKLGWFKADKIPILEQEKGYHIFELFGYAHIAMMNREEPLFRTKAFRKALDYAMDIDAMNRRLGTADPKTMNPYAYGYNSPAFEWPLVERVFTGRLDERGIRKLFALQKKLTYNERTGSFDRNNADPDTLTARLYECVSFCDYCRESG